MKTESKSGSFASARGQNFSPAVEFPFTVNLYETTEELVAAKDELTLEDQLKVRNAERITRARQAAQNALLDKMGVEKQDINNNEAIRFREFLKVLKSAGFSDEDAKSQAVKTLGYDPDAAAE
jgi:uncharacterized surface protein with fasciclin (FAS1) repeats